MSSRSRTHVFAPLLRVLTVPESSDEEQARRAGLTMSVIRLMLAATGFVALLAFADARNEPAVTLVTYSPLVMTMLGSAVLVRRGKLNLAGWMITGSFWAFITGILWFFGGLHEQSATPYVVAMMIAGGTLGGRAAIGVAVASAMASGFVAACDAMGMLPPPFAAMSGWNAWIATTTSMLMAAYLLGISMRSLEEARERARTNELGLRRAEARNAARARHGEAVGRLGTKVLETVSPRQFCREACETIASVLEIESIAVLASPDQDRVRVLGSLACASPVDGYLTMRSGTAIEPPGRVGDAIEVCVTADPVLGGLAGRDHEVAVLSTIPAPGGHSGVLCAFPPRDRSFDPEEKLFFSTVAGLLGAALERASASLRFLQTQKMEIVGRLAGGVAHDFNNLLTVMTNVSSALRESSAGNSSSLHLLDDLDSASDRAALMTGQLLAFSRSGLNIHERVDIQAAVENLLPVIRRLLGADYEIREHHVDDPIFIRTDPVGLDQVILNLAVNARDAMPNGGTLTFRSGRHSAASGESRVWLSVSDTGGGLDEATRKRIFEPFFTTKRGGTGLGLSTVRDIVSRADGEMTIESRSGEGASFRIEFPEDVVSQPEPIESARLEPASGCGRVLLVEDDDLVRRSVERTLRAGGYDVAEAIDGASALDLLERAPEFDAIVTDLNMPKLGGLELAQRLRELGIAIPIIFVSGRAEEPPDRLAEYHVPTRFVQKPFEMADFLSKIQDCIREFKSADS